MSVFAQATGLAIIVAIAIFGVVSAVAWLLFDLLFNKKRQAEDRLDRMRDPGQAAKIDTGGADKVSEAMANLLEKATPRLAKPLQPKDELEVGKLKLRLAHAGFRTDSAPTIFLGLKVFCLIVGLCLSGGLVFFSEDGLNRSLITRIVIISGVSFFLPDLILYLFRSKRNKALFLSLPDVIDLMVVCVEAGLGLDQAMAKVAEEMKKCYPLIAQEFRIANMQLQMGASREMVLRDLGQRNGEEDLDSLTSMLIQSGKFGSGVGQALRTQSDAMRTRRRQLAEEKAAKTAVQLIFPLVLFIFPGIFVVLVGPAAVNIFNNLLPTMGG